MRWTAVAAGFFAVALATAAFGADGLSDGRALAQAPQPPNTVKMEPVPAGQAKTYLHPLRKFTLAVPPGANVAERGDMAQVSIRSRQGYLINVQTGDANPAVELPQMAAKLEARYLGTGKPWARKLGERKTTLAGLEANETEYEGSGTRIRVIIARGKKTDFVFMFFAPTDSFEELEPRFKWVLANFTPNPADNPAAAGLAPVPAKAPPPTSAPPKRFAAGGYGYTIQYPGDWELSTPTAAVATFSGKSGTDAFQVVVSIQNVQPPSAKTPDQAATAALAGLKKSLEQAAADLTVIGERPLTYKNGDLSLAGRQMVVTYTFAGQRYRKWALVVPRPAGTVAHIWSYTAPEAGFETYRPFADAMLRSWTIRTEDG